MIKLGKYAVATILFSSALINALAYDVATIGMQVWYNEAKQRVSQLVFWHEGEQYLSLGIGHFKWYQASVAPQHEHLFPELCAYLQLKGIELPAWLIECKESGAPWQTRAQWQADTEKITQLQQLLESTLELQQKFLVDRLDAVWPMIMNACSEDEREYVHAHYEQLRSTVHGTYILVDYLNFNGSGLEHSYERAECGLLQVLRAIPADFKAQDLPNFFALCAACRMLQYIKNSVPDYQALRYMRGWMKRIGSYTQAV